MKKDFFHNWNSKIGRSFYIFFYGDKMAIISYDKQELLGVIIQSAVNTQTQKAMFDLAWLGATSFIVR